MRAVSIHRILILCLGVLLVTGAVRSADDKTVNLKDLDQRISDVLRDVINAGADLYNPPVNDRGACYRFYQGSLTTIRPLLAHRPKLQETIDAGLAEAQRKTAPGERAFVLRGVIDQIRTEVKPPETKTPAATTTWDKLGGEKGVSKIVDDFVTAASADPKVNFTRDGKFKPDAAQVTAVKKRLVEMISEATSGPLKYSGASMKDAHKGMGITDVEFDALAGHLKKALEKNDVKSENAEAVLKAFGNTRKDIVEKKAPEEKKEKK